VSEVFPVCREDVSSPCGKCTKLYKSEEVLQLMTVDDVLRLVGSMDDKSLCVYLPSNKCDTLLEYGSSTGLSGRCNETFSVSVSQDFLNFEYSTLYSTSLGPDMYVMLCKWVDERTTVGFIDCRTPLMDDAMKLKGVADAIYDSKDVVYVSSLARKLLGSRGGSVKVESKQQSRKDEMYSNKLYSDKLCTIAPPTKNEFTRTGIVCTSWTTSADTSGHVSGDVRIVKGEEALADFIPWFANHIKSNLDESSYIQHVCISAYVNSSTNIRISIDVGHHPEPKIYLLYEYSGIGSGVSYNLPLTKEGAGVVIATTTRNMGLLVACDAGKETSLLERLLVTV